MSVTLEHHADTMQIKIAPWIKLGSTIQPVVCTHDEYIHSQQNKAIS